MLNRLEKGEILCDSVSITDHSRCTVTHKARTGSSTSIAAHPIFPPPPPIDQGRRWFVVDTANRNPRMTGSATEQPSAHIGFVLSDREFDLQLSRPPSHEPTAHDGKNSRPKSMQKNRLGADLLGRARAARPSRSTRSGPNRLGRFRSGSRSVVRESSRSWKRPACAQFIARIEFSTKLAKSPKRIEPSDHLDRTNRRASVDGGPGLRPTRDVLMAQPTLIRENCEK